MATSWSCPDSTDAGAGRHRGGRWGDPHERPVEDVVEDVLDGYITLEQAERDYGVVLDPRTHEVKEVRR